MIIREDNGYYFTGQKKNITGQGRREELTSDLEHDL